MEKWCPKCMKFVITVIELDTEMICSCCKNVFDEKQEARGIFHYLWGTSAPMRDERGYSIYHKLWNRLRELLRL